MKNKEKLARFYAFPAYWLIMQPTHRGCLLQKQASNSSQETAFSSKRSMGYLSHEIFLAAKFSI